jgi:FAD/FMN-containing dehydrogenase
MMGVGRSLGETIRIGTNAMKSSSGYDLCRLFVGSEGTLGVMTETTLRLVGLPSEFMAAVLANGGGYYSQQMYLSEARRLGLTLRAPHINYSDEAFSVSTAPNQATSK